MVRQPGCRPKDPAASQDRPGFARAPTLILTPTSPHRAAQDEGPVHVSGQDLAREPELSEPLELTVYPLHAHLSSLEAYERAWAMHLRDFTIRRFMLRFARQRNRTALAAAGQTQASEDILR